jgi:prevent-host-death family protein
MTIKTLKSDAARNAWRDVIDDVATGDDVVIVERYNKPLVAVIPYAAFLALQEEIDEWRTAQQAQAVLDAWRKDPSTARPWEEVESELVANGLLDAEEDDPLHRRNKPRR